MRRGGSRPRRDVPLGITYQGGIGLVDPEARPNVFRIAPTDHGLAFRLAEYLIPKRREARAARPTTAATARRARTRSSRRSADQESVVARIDLPASRDRRRAAGATRPEGGRHGAARLGAGAGDRGNDHRRSQRGVGRPDLHAAVGRRPARPPGARRQAGLGRRPDLRVRPHDRRGRDRRRSSPSRGASRPPTAPQEVGVKTSDGKDVIQPPEYAMYSFDFVRVLAAAHGVRRHRARREGDRGARTGSRSPARTGTSGASTS